MAILPITTPSDTVIAPLSLGGNFITNNTTINPNIIDKPISGKMLVATLRLSAYEAMQMDDLEMKNRLITMMVREIMDHNCIEFTKQKDVASNEMIIRARIFVTPNGDVQLLRKVQK